MRNLEPEDDLSLVTIVRLDSVLSVFSSPVVAGVSTVVGSPPGEAALVGIKCL